MKIKRILIVCLVAFMFMITGCTTASQKTLSNLYNISNSIYSNAEQVTETTVPKYPENVATEGKDNFISLVSNSSAETIVKISQLQDGLDELKNTNIKLDNITKQLNKNKQELLNEEISTIKTTTTNCNTINNNISEKLVDFKQQVATINAEITSVTNSTSGTSNAENNVNSCYTKIYNDIDYIKTEVNEVNTLINSIIEMLNKYIQPEQTQPE